MQRWSWLVAGAVALAAAPEVVAKPRWVPPIERNCAQPMTWNALTACMKRSDAARATIVSWSQDLRVVESPSSGVYLYLRNGEQWRMIATLGDANYELLAMAPITLGREAGTRVEMGHVVDMTPDGWFR